MVFRSLALVCWVVVAALALSGCGSMDRAERADAARRGMIGMTKEHILACMGPPKQQAEEGSTEVWSYDSKDGRSTSRNLTQKLGKTGLTFTDGVREKNFCTVNVVMTKGAVAAVHYYGPRGGLFSHDEQCGYAVEHCVE